MRSFILLTAFLLTCFVQTQAQSTYYKVKFPDDKTIYGCYEYPDTTYPVIEQYPGCNFNVGVSVKDQVFNLNAWGGCKKILRTWTLINWCTYDPNEPWPVYIQNPPDTDVGATVFGVTSNRGHITYVQILKVLDLAPPVFVNCPTDPVVFCDYTGNDASQYNDGHNDKCEGPVNLSVKVTDLCSEADINLQYRLYLDMDCNGTMETYISSSSPNAWPIDKTGSNGDTLMATVGFPAGFGLPYATHKIEWIANDNCGNEALCKYAFTVKDCKAPTVVCLNGLSINIMSVGMITLWDTDFIQYVSDNCTPSNQIKIGIRKAGTGTGFPTDSHSVTFTCSELGSQLVEVWAQDAYGNADYCSTYVIVQDNIGACPPSKPFKGSVATNTLKPLPGVQLTLKKGAQTLASSLTGPDGKFTIGAIQAGCNYTLIPKFDDQAKDGINAMDALLLAAHLDEIAVLPTPYQLLAADVDKDGKLTDADILNIVKVNLGAQNAFPVNKVWQFIPGNYTFANPLKPWSNAIPAALTFCLSGDMNNPYADFVGIKYGDVDASADPTQLTTTDDRSKEGRAIFTTTEKTFKAGQEIRVDLISPDLSGYAAFQYTLDFDHTMLANLKVEPDLVPAEYVAVPQEGHITTSWHNSIMLDPTITGKNMYLRVYTLVFTTLKDGKLSDALHISSAVTKAEVYTRKLQTVKAELSFLPEPKLTKGLVVFPSHPNPVTDHFTTAYYLQEAGMTTITLTDATGRVLQSEQSYQERGYHESEMQLNGSVKPGLLFLRVEAPGGAEVQRVMKN